MQLFGVIYLYLRNSISAHIDYKSGTQSFLEERYYCVLGLLLLRYLILVSNFLEPHNASCSV